MSTRLSASAPPGSIPTRLSSEPSFFIARNCSRKSSSVNWPLRIFSSIRLASSMSTASAAFSTRLTTSPMPRMREAIRSGWNGSNSSSFSPMPANLIGLPVTALKLSAAPPRASPSSLVRIAPVILQRLVEVRRHIHRLLARGRVQHEQDFLRLDQVAQPHQFLHQRLVNLQPAGRVENERVAVVLPGEIQRLAGDFQNIRFPFERKDGHLDLPAQGFQLLHGRRAVDVRRHQQRLARLLLQPAGQLGAGGRLARAVQARQHQAARIAAQRQPRVGRAEQLDQFVMDNLDDLLSRLDALHHLLSERLGLDLLDEIARHLEIDIGVQQRHAHLAQGVAGVGLGNLAQPAEVAEGVLQLLA